MTALMPTLIVLAFGMSVVSTLAHAETIKMDQLPYSDQFLVESVGLISHSSALEGAQSHGQIGGSIGIGIRQPQRIFKDPEFDTSGESQNFATQIHVVKGLDAPVDVGFSFSHASDTPGNSLAAYVQWTVFENFQLPSLAIRVGYGQSFGYEFLDVNTTSAEILAGYDLFQFLGFYSGVGASFVRAQFDLENQSETIALARESSELINTRTVSSAWQDQHFSAGISLKPLPPFLALGAEYLRNNRNLSTYAVKIAVGM